MKILFIAAAVACLAAPVAAQQTSMRAPYSGGLSIKGGFSYGNVTNRGVFPGDARHRSGAAIGVSLVSGGVLGLGVEGLYAQRGVSSSAPGGSRELDYIDVPVFVRLAAPNPAIEPFVYAGPQVSFELKCESNGIDCPSGRPKTSYAGVIGAGVRLRSVGGVSLEGRYVYGLSDLELLTISNADNYKTRSFLILAGLTF